MVGSEARLFEAAAKRLPTRLAESVLRIWRTLSEELPGLPPPTMRRLHGTEAVLSWFRSSHYVELWLDASGVTEWYVSDSADALILHSEDDPSDLSAVRRVLAEHHGSGDA